MKQASQDEGNYAQARGLKELSSFKDYDYGCQAQQPRQGELFPQTLQKLRGEAGELRFLRAKLCKLERRLDHFEAQRNPDSATLTERLPHFKSADPVTDCARTDRGPQHDTLSGFQGPKRNRLAHEVSGLFLAFKAALLSKLSQAAALFPPEAKAHGQLNELRAACKTHMQSLELSMKQVMFLLDGPAMEADSGSP